MPSDIDELQQQIADLEEEIEASDDDGGKALKDYEARLKQIDEGKAKVQASEVCHRRPDH